MLSTYLKKHKDTDSNNMYAVVLFFWMISAQLNDILHFIIYVADLFLVVFGLVK